jgi:hypothetical protein
MLKCIKTQIINNNLYYVQPDEKSVPKNIKKIDKEITIFMKNGELEDLDICHVGQNVNGIMK